jgi:hypothetical protein
MWATYGQRVGLGCVFRSQTWSPTPCAGGAPKEDLQAFSGQNVSMDMATFKKLPLETLVVGGGGASGGTGTWAMEEGAW